jgi:hypothetical protein
LTPTERILRARVAAYTLHSRVDSREHTVPARTAAWERFEKQVDPEGKLSPAERARRADAARSAYFSQLAAKSVEARRIKARERRGDPIAKLDEARLALKSAQARSKAPKDAA